MWLSASARLDTNSTLMEDRASTQMNVSTKTDTASTSATTKLVITLVLAIQAMIWCPTVSRAYRLIHVPWTMVAVTTSVHLPVPLECAVVDLAMSLPPMELLAMWSIHVPWITVAVSSFVQCLVILECVAANLAFSCPVMERRVLTLMSVQAMEGRVTASMLAWTPSAPECAPAQLDTSFLQTECLAKVSTFIKLLLHCISNGPVWSCSI